MGSKRVMLGNGLGEALGRSVKNAKRVFDLFSGSAAVAWHVAENYEKEVISCDLQQYSTVLAASVIERTEAITDFTWADAWFRSARARIVNHRDWSRLKGHQSRLGSSDVSGAAEEARAFDLGERFPISRAYGGHYFSPWQSAWLDALRASIPSDPVYRNVALAALIQAASRCAASPGHTAQPFKPNETAGPFLIEAWQRDLPNVVATRVKEIAPRVAKIRGQAHCANALEIADQAEVDDLAFVDPPYSGVHYSRFYHVLETVARGRVGTVAGIGRYPPTEERPSSSFSMKTQAHKAFDELLAVLARRGASVIITFPSSKASNGLSGDDVKLLAAQHFRIEEEKVSSRFSTLGGDTKHRAARQDAHELILTLSASN
ncbi:DNA adenine methylase [Xanthobacter flavus]|uniref:DNA adenine methylase n=1 Tax=Xanthobacter flavus TaxID=281 RepID=UPI003726D8FE